MWNPYISIVATARNDNHGGNFSKRLGLFIQGIIDHANVHRLQTELILVEWNPPGDQRTLAEAFAHKVRGEYCRLRIIQVPASVHNRYQYAQSLPLYQMIGKNVGIRRALGEFILATNVDIFFSHEMFELFKSGLLKRNKLYRAARYDVEEDLPVNASLDQQIAYCRSHLIRVNNKMGIASTSHEESYPHNPKWVDTNLARYKRKYKVLPLFTLACGDFQLMHTDNWKQTRAYPEFDTFSFHIDSIFQCQAHFAGAREEILREPFRIYHLEHASDWTPEAQKSGRSDHNLAKRGLKRISDGELASYMQEITNSAHPTLFNSESWGLVNDVLPETTLSARQQ